jgi:hypothetical protein
VNLPAEGKPQPRLTFWAVLGLAAVALVARPPGARADAIIITKAMTASTIAEIFIDESSIRVELEIGGRDLPGFRNLMPDGVYARMGYEPEPFAG